MDFSAWFEVFLAGRWYTKDARHNHPRIGRIVMGRGRDAADVAMSTAFGVANLVLQRRGAISDRRGSTTVFRTCINGPGPARPPVSRV
jgi:transglutaminase-like putative cysteine protease